MLRDTVQTPVMTVSGRLLFALIAAICLAPVYFWFIAEGGATTLDVTTGPSDRYYSLPDRRYYTLLDTDVITISHTLEAPVSVFYYSDTLLGRPGLLKRDIPASTPTPIILPLGKLILVAKNQIGYQASFNLLYWPSATTTGLLTRTLDVSMSNLATTATYVAVASTDTMPIDFTDLLTGTMEQGLFIKRAFYSDFQLGTGRKFECPYTGAAFTGDEVSTIEPTQVLVKNKLIQVTLQTRASDSGYQPAVVAQRLLCVPPAPGVATHMSFSHTCGSVRWPPDPPVESWEGGELTWTNPANATKLDYTSDPSPIANVTACDSLLVPISGMAQVVDPLRRYDFLFSLLTTLLLPLLPWIWLRRLRHGDLAGTWFRLAAPLGLGALLWLGPLGSMTLSSIVRDAAHGGGALWVAVCSSALAVAVLSAPATAPKLIAQIRVWSSQRRAIIWSGLLLLAAFPVALELALLRNHIWRYPFTLPLEGLLLALAGWSLVRAFSGGRGLMIARPIWIAWAMALILLAVPLPYTARLFDPIGWPPEIGRNLFLPWGLFVMPYLGLLCSLVALKERDIDDPLPTGLGRFIFVFLVGFTGVFPQVLLDQGDAPLPIMLSPIPFLLAWLLFPLICRPAPGADVRSSVFVGRKELLAQPGRSLNIAHEMVLAFGPRSGNWGNGRLGARHGLIMGGIVTLLYVALLVPSVADQIANPFLPFIVLVAFILPVFLRWVLSGFFLGYFFACLPGRNGAVKGLCLAGAIAASVFAYDLIFRVSTGADLVIFFALDVVLTILGLMGLGAALDYHTIQDAGYPWQQLLALYRVPFLATYISGLLVAAASTIIGLINGRVADLMASLADAILGR